MTTKISYTDKKTGKTITIHSHDNKVVDYRMINGQLATPEEVIELLKEKTLLQRFIEFIKSFKRK